MFLVCYYGTLSLSRFKDLFTSLFFLRKLILEIGVEAAPHTDTHLHSSLILRNRIFVVLSRVGLFRVHIISAEKCHTPFLYFETTHSQSGGEERRYVSMIQ